MNLVLLFDQASERPRHSTRCFTAEALCHNMFSYHTCFLGNTAVLPNVCGWWPSV